MKVKESDAYSVLDNLEFSMCTISNIDITWYQVKLIKLSFENDKMMVLGLSAGDWPPRII